MKTRLRYMDMAKAIAMFSVVYSHCCQRTAPDGMYLVLSVATSFHMPLFMMISGYFIINTLNLGILDFLRKVMKYYIIPFVCFSFLGQIILLCQNPPSGILGFIVRWWPFLWMHDFWFVRDLVLFIVLTYIGYNVAKKNFKIAFFLSFFILNMIPTDIGLKQPDDIFTPVRNSSVFLYPFFWIGIYLKEKPEILNKFRLKYLLPISCFLLLFFKFDYSWYNWSHYTLIDFLTRDIECYHSLPFFALCYRYVIGIILSVTIIQGCQRLDKIIVLERINNYVGGYGKYTLGIYLIHTILLSLFTSYYFWSNSLLLDYIIFPFIIIVISWGLSYVIEKSPFKYLLGK